MRRKISLYIADRLVDTDDQNLILFNYTMEDLLNPTIVRNSYSQQITLPATPENNKIFGHYFRLDRVTGNGFNVLVRTPFKIYNEMNEILESGYCKLDSVQSRGKNVFSYSISLFGGLGGFFYDLTYKEDGSVMNLGDLTYTNGLGATFVPNTKNIAFTAANMSYCWNYLQGSSTIASGYEWCNVVNFAPCYNGVPADFDANKAIVTNGSYFKIEPSGTTGVNDRPHPNANGNYIVQMETPKYADEVRDYRVYLQRPVLSIKSFIDALVARGGFSVSVGAMAILDNDMYVTLQLPKRALSYTSYPMKSFFDGTMSPSDLLISLGKTFGLVFLTNQDGVTMMTRDEFFTGGKEIDLSSRMGSMDMLTPMTFDSKWYMWQNEVKGEFADNYLDNWGRVYGGQKVNTGYEFNTDIKVLTDSIKTQGAVQSLQWSSMFQFLYGSKPLFPAAVFEKVSFIGYNTNGTSSSNIDVPPYLAYGNNKVYYNNDYPLQDVFDKPQLHGESQKPVDGAGVLVYYTGHVQLPVISVGSNPSLNDKLIWHLTDDDQDIINLLNDGNPCWDMRFLSGTRVTTMPKFSRWDSTKNESLDFGEPLEIDVPGTTYPSNTIYGMYWKKYVEDRFDMDTTILRCKVNLGGLHVGQDLLRNFYWYDNTWWVLNKIVNHSLTTYDQTECEFVRVQDKLNYTNSQS